MKISKYFPIILPLIMSIAFIQIQANEVDPFSDDNVIEVNANQAVKEINIQKDQDNQKFNEINNKQDDVLSVIKKKKNPSLEDVSSSIKNSMFGTDKNITQVEPLPQKPENPTLTEAEDEEKNKANSSIEEQNGRPLQDEEKIPELQPIKGIKYYKELDWFSIIDHNQTGFSDYVKKLNLPSFTLDKLKDRTDSGIALAVNAFAYDYGLQNAPMAENFYKEFLGRSDISFYDRELRYADFLIRTGRPQKVLEFLNNSVCMNHINFMASCDYYLGVARYLMTGDNKNINIRTAKDYFDKASILFYQNDKK